MAMPTVPPQDLRHDIRLHWETEDERKGEVLCVCRGPGLTCHFPHQGRVFFSDDEGPVYRQDDIEEACYQVFHKVTLGDGVDHVFRVLRVKAQGVYRYVIPGAFPVIIACQGEGHEGHDPVRAACCLEVDAILEQLVRR